MVVKIDIKIKIKNKDLRQICLIFKYPINKDLQKRVSVVFEYQDIEKYILMTFYNWLVKIILKFY